MAKVQSNIKATQLGDKWAVIAEDVVLRDGLTKAQATSMAKTIREEIATEQPYPPDYMIEQHFKGRVVIDFSYSWDEDESISVADERAELRDNLRDVMEDLGGESKYKMKLDLKKVATKKVPYKD